MNSPIVSTFALASLLVAPAVAQQTTVMHLDTDAGVYTTAAGKDDFKSAPKGTQIPPVTWTFRLSNSLRTGSGATQLSASQTLWASTQHDGNGGGMGFSGLARGTSKEFSHTTASQSKTGTPGPVAFLAKMTHTANRKGVIRITWQSLYKNSATSAVTVDVGNDGSVEFKGGDTKAGIDTVDIPATFDSGGNLAIRLTLDGSLQGAGQYDYSSLYSRLTFRYVDPQNSSCTVTTYGSGCQGTAVAGSVLTLPNEHVVTVKMTGGFPNAFVVEAAGNQSINLPLPGGCSLLSNALVVLLHKTDAQGEFMHLRKVSKFTSSVSYHQYLPIDLQNGQLVVRGSNGLKVICIGAR